MTIQRVTANSPAQAAKSRARGPVELQPFPCWHWHALLLYRVEYTRLVWAPPVVWAVTHRRGKT